jgi:hypothetical protein
MGGSYRPVLRSYNLNLHAVGETVGRILDHAVCDRYSFRDLQLRTEIAADLDLPDLDPAFRIHHADSGSFRAEKQYIGGHKKRLGVSISMKMNLRVGAWEKLSGFVRDLKLSQQCVG